jgi:hypothetical protein
MPISSKPTSRPCRLSAGVLTNVPNLAATPHPVIVFAEERNFTRAQTDHTSPSLRSPNRLPTSTLDCEELRQSRDDFCWPFFGKKVSCSGHNDVAGQVA